MTSWLTPLATYTLLLVVQSLHLLHRRIAKRHISYAEVLSSATLIFHPAALPMVPAPVFVAAHLLLSSVQVVGSLWIRRLSPAWETRPADL